MRYKMSEKIETNKEVLTNEEIDAILFFGIDDNIDTSEITIVRDFGDDDEIGKIYTFKSCLK
jgi:hypothetical protein